MLICLPAEADIVLDSAGKGNNCRQQTVRYCQQAITGALPTAITYMLIGIFPTGAFVYAKGLDHHILFTKITIYLWACA